jgi:hypothetical protein
MLQLFQQCSTCKEKERVGDVASIYVRSSCLEARQPPSGGEPGTPNTRDTTHQIQWHRHITTSHVTDRIIQFRLQPATSILIAADWPLEMTC